MTEQELLLSKELPDVNKYVTRNYTRREWKYHGNKKYKLSAQERREIYALWKRRDVNKITQVELSNKYNVARGTIQNIIKDMKTPVGLKKVYWKGSLSQSYAEEAKRILENLSDKYNTPNHEARR